MYLEFLCQNLPIVNAVVGPCPFSSELCYLTLSKLLCPSPVIVILQPVSRSWRVYQGVLYKALGHYGKLPYGNGHFLNNAPEIQKKMVLDIVHIYIAQMYVLKVIGRDSVGQELDRNLVPCLFSRWSLFCGDIRLTLMLVEESNRSLDIM